MQGYGGVWSAEMMIDADIDDIERPLKQLFCNNTLCIIFCNNTLCNNNTLYKEHTVRSSSTGMCIRTPGSENLYFNGHTFIFAYFQPTSVQYLMFMWKGVQKCRPTKTPGGLQLASGKTAGSIQTYSSRKSCRIKWDALLDKGIRNTVADSVSFLPREFP